MYYYNRKKFNILDGFRDNSSPTMLKGDNKFLCNSCNKLQEAQTTCKIFEPPQKLLINIDYGKNKKYQPTAIEFSEEIDITKFVDFNFQQKIIYKIIGVCTHYGHSGSYGHYVAFCRNRENDKWYEFLIKEREEVSEDYTFTYTATDAFINELSKTGYNVEFATDLNNNQGTVVELAKETLKNTDWVVDEANSDIIRQLISEPIYLCQVTEGSFEAKNLDTERNITINTNMVNVVN